MAGQPKTRAKEAMESAIAPEEIGTELPPDEGTARDDRPPRASRKRKAADPPTASGGTGSAADRRPANIRKLHDGLTQSFMLAGLGLSMLDPFDGQVIALNAETLARSWADLAQQSPTVRKYLEKLLQGGAWGAAIGSTAMVCVPILVRHGYAPFDLAVMAAGNGVKIPQLEMPPEPDSIPHPMDGGDATPPAATNGHAERHPFDGSPVDADSLPSEPIAFPRDSSAGFGPA